MFTAPTAPTQQHAHTPLKIRLYRYLAGLALVLLGTAAYMFPDAAWWLSGLSTLAGIVAGKYLGVPHRDVIQLGLQLMAPEQAVSVTIKALKSLPPEQAEAAAETLLASLPPAAVPAVVQRLSITPPAPIGVDVRFIGTTEPPLAEDETTTPSRPRSQR